MNSLISNVMQYIPAEIDLLSSVKFIGIVAVGILVLGFLGRITMGKRSDLNHAVSSAVGILFIYGLTVVVYSFGVTLLERFLSPLPFVSISGDYLTLLDFRGAEITDICYHILSMVILAFLINLLDTLIPKGENVFIWYLLRFTTVLLSMVLHAIVSWALATYLPDVLVTYAPILLLAVLALMLLLGLLKLILGVALTAVQTTVTTILQERTESAMQGRVFGLMGSLYASCYPFGMVLFGTMADRFPLRAIMVFSGAALIALAAIAYGHPHLRDA